MKKAHFLDKYIQNKNLTKEDLNDMSHSQIKLCSYNIASIPNYDVIWGRLALLQRKKRCWFLKDIFHIIDNTMLSNWQKFKLKVAYCFF